MNSERRVLAVMDRRAKTLAKHGLLAFGGFALVTALVAYRFLMMGTCGGLNAPRVRGETGARVVRMAVQQWQASTSSDGCPSIAQLQTERFLDPGQPETDPWGTAYRIACEREEVTVRSSGPDRRWQTGDDIAVPKGHAASVR